MTYKTLSYMTSNEDGQAEVEIVYERGFWRWLFNKPECREVYIKLGTLWCDKKTRQRADWQKEAEIYEVVRRLTYTWSA